MSTTADAPGQREVILAASGAGRDSGMRDIQLWWRLHTAPGPELCDELEALALLPMRERAPFLGLIVPLLGHADVRLRRAAVTNLAGARGMAGMRAIVDALDDDDASVRLNAVEALREVAASEASRWAHAVFHPRPDVRAAALQGKTHQNCAHFGAYLRADPHNRAAAELIPFPKPGLGLLFGLWQRGAIDANDAAARLAQASQAHLRAWITDCHRRPLESTRSFIRSAVSAVEVAPVDGSDGLDAWVEIVAAADAAVASAAVAALAEAILNSKLLEHRPRLTIAVVHVGGITPEKLPASLLMLAAAAEPRFLLMMGYSPAVRRIAATGLAAHRAHIGGAGRGLVPQLLESDLVKKADGTLDLLVAVGIVGLLPSGRLERLVTQFGLDTIAVHIPRDLQAWVAICDLPDEADAWSTRLLAAAAEHDEHTRSTVTAIALGRFALSRHGALERTLAAAAPIGPLLVELVTQAQSGTIPATPDLMGRLANTLAPHACIGELDALFAALVERMGHAPISAAIAVFAAVASSCAPDDFAIALSSVPSSAVANLIPLMGDPLVLSDEHNEALAQALAGDEHPTIAQWLAERAARHVPSPAVARVHVERELSDEETARIVRADLATLPAALRPALEQPATGLTRALTQRPPTSHSSIAACVAIIGCADAPQEAWAHLDQWHLDDDDAFAANLDEEVRKHWLRLPNPSWLAQAWQHRHDQHAFAMLARIDSFEGGMRGVLVMVDGLRGAVARRKLWQAIASAMTLRRYRQRARLIAALSEGLDELIAHIVAQLDTDVGVFAAKLLVTLHLAGLKINPEVRKQVLGRACDMDRETIHELARFVRIGGLPVRTVAARRRNRLVGANQLEEISESTDLELLQARCRGASRHIVAVAARRLVELGSLGERRLTDLLAGTPPVQCFAAIADTLETWTDTVSLERVREVARDPSTPAEMQYRLASAFHRRGESGWIVPILRALRAPTSESWFGREEWDALVELYPASPRQLALGLTDSPHPHIYRNAVELLLADPSDDESLAAFRVFIEQGSVRPTDLRRITAKHLIDNGDPIGLPILMSAVAEPDRSWEQWRFTPPTPELGTTVAELLLAACVVGGAPACGDARLLDLATLLKVPGSTISEIGAQLLADSRSPATCKRIVQARSLGARRTYKIREIAEMFAWGVRRGRELTGRLFQVHMTWRRGDYGHTYLNSNAIHVTPLPVLRGDRDGRDIVEALILHEFGHHKYHRGEESMRVWQRATQEGLGHLLNLVADEHLERNLRAVQPEYGDRLKRLASYAFQHNEREMAVDPLLVMLGAAAFDALSLRPLGVAYDGRCITLLSGDLLRELERAGNPFARFIRALRQGLGNRHNDPVVAEALSLFRGGFRRSDMRAMYGIAKRLQELFGMEARLAEQFGGHETIKGSAREGAVHGEDINDEDVQREVERILDPRQLDRMREGKDDGGKPTRLALNAIDDDAFKKINNIVRVPPDPEKHRVISAEVRRHANRVRRYFEEMGLNYVPKRARLRGRAFDRTRARAVVLRQDPRMLIAREVAITSDLFIGVVIDCSGSMRSGGSMAKAHRFGVLLADAIRGMSNVEARFFGFTDSVIYDAGDERMCAAANLETGGGNNDAAALYHAAAIADRSRRKSKLLVMISDGLPTECSVVALRGLVQRITRRQGILCAQVAVRPLSEICFPHYVEIHAGDELDVAVRRFGEIVSKLAKRALGH